MALAAIDVGVHVLVEKPIAHTFGYAREVVMVAKKKSYTQKLVMA